MIGQGYSAVDNVRQKFTSKEQDTETGLDFFGARYYSSVQGRFTSVDPIKLAAERLLDPQRLNLYGYCRDNPLKYIDPDGEDLVLANAGARARFRQVVAPGLTKAERRNLKIVGNQVQLRNPNLRGSSPAYGYLTEMIGNSNLTVNYYAVAPGQTVTTATGVTATYQNAVDAHGLATGSPGDSVRDVIVPVGGSTPVDGIPAGSGNTTPMPEDVIFAHEAYGHALDNDAVQVENEYRASRDPALPARSGKDHTHGEVTVVEQPGLLQTPTTLPATQIIPRPLIPLPPPPPPPPRELR